MLTHSQTGDILFSDQLSFLIYPTAAFWKKLISYLQKSVYEWKPNKNSSRNFQLLVHHISLRLSGGCWVTSIKTNKKGKVLTVILPSPV